MLRLAAGLVLAIFIATIAAALVVGFIALVMFVAYMVKGYSAMLLIAILISVIAGVLAWLEDKELSRQWRRDMGEIGEDI